MADSENIFERLRKSVRRSAPAAVTSFRANVAASANGSGKSEEFIANGLREVVMRSANLEDPDCETRQLLRGICKAAHASHTSVEALLILLKEMWIDLPPALPGRHAEAQAALSRIVSVCIEEYFDERPLS